MSWSGGIACEEQPGLAWHGIVARAHRMTRPAEARRRFPKPGWADTERVASPPLHALLRPLVHLKKHNQVCAQPAVVEGAESL